MKTTLQSITYSFTDLVRVRFEPHTTTGKKTWSVFAWDSARDMAWDDSPNYGPTQENATLFHKHFIKAAPAPRFNPDTRII